MGNTSTEKKKRRLRRKNVPKTSNDKPKNEICISCGNEELTVDETGRCESCRRDLYEADCFMCDFD